MTKQDAIKALRKYLAKLFSARYDGTETVTYARDQGFADGYMQALEDLALTENRELLRIIGEERSRAAQKADRGLGAIPAQSPVEHFA